MNFGMFLAVGKPGKKPAFPSRELMANERGRDNQFAALIWSDDARGSLLDPTALGLSRIVDFYCLFDVGCVSGCTLFLRQLHFTVLFAGDFWRVAAQLVWYQAIMVAELASIFTSVVGALGPRRLSAHLLLLSRCLLQVVLGRSAGMHRGGTSKDLSGRTFLPPDYAKRTPLFSLSRVHLSRHPHDRCLEGTLVCRCYQREKFIWYRHRYDCARHQCCPARWLYLWLSFPAAFGRGISRSVFKITKLLPRLRMRELFQSPSHALGMAQFVLGRLRGSLRPILLDGCLA